MTKTILYISSLLLAVSFASCKDCTRYARAYVVDRETKKGIYGVKVESYAALNDRARDRRVVYTDSAGWFETAFSLKGVAKCGNLKLIISHPNYPTVYEIDLPVDDTIRIQRIAK